MSVFAVVKLRKVDNSNNEYWSVYPPNEKRIDCTDYDTAIELCGGINMQIMEKLPVKIGGYKS
jgi:hypothetical protein